jgi:serine protease Do
VYETDTVFFARQRIKFGAIFLPVPPTVAAQIGRNAGLLIAVVVRGGEAQRAELLEGDVILSVDGQELRDADNHELFNQLMDRHPGRPVAIEIWRKGNTMTKSVSWGA